MEKRRLGKTNQMSSILIFGGFALFHISQKDADAAIEMALASGINQVDVSPFYGEAEKHLGSWFKRHGKQFFISCKTAERKKKGAWEGIKKSLETLHVDHFDIFQLHGVDDLDVLKTALGPGGAMEAILEAKEQGLVRFIGITGHNPPLYNQALQLFDFDTVMFPLNRVHAAHPTDWNDFRPLLKTARQKDVGLMAIKSIAKRAWEGEQARKHHDTWYEPFTDPAEIEKSLRYTLSQDITAAILPGELSIWPKMIEVAQSFKPMTAKEQQDAMAGVIQYQPLVGPQMD
jgi:aryl-alcohol dehydrogenase-like predicted oxidoreductase